MEISILVYRLEVLTNFQEKGIVPANTGETINNHTGEGMPIFLVTMERILLSLETLQEHRMKYFPLHLHLLHAVELFLGQGIYSLPQRHLSWKEL